MKKIKSIQQLQQEQKQVQQHRQLLEQKIHQEWQGLRLSLKPSSLVRDTVGGLLQSKAIPMLLGSNVLKGTAAVAVTLLAQQLAVKTGKGIWKLFKRK